MYIINNVELIKLKIIKPNSSLYRFVSCKSPNEVIIGRMWPNCGKDGRFNKYRDIYYCCDSLSAVSTENKQYNKQHELLKGSLIESKVISELKLGQVYNDRLSVYLNGLTKDELSHFGQYNPELYTFKESLGLTKEIDYSHTSYIAEMLFEFFPDGIAIPSIHGFPNGIQHGGKMFCISDDDKEYTENYDLNIVLTKCGYDKIKEYPPIIFWQ